MEKGYVQIYTGNGKGKTTAALGLTLRAVGGGLKVYIGQFIKHGDFSEIIALQFLGGSVKLEQYGSGFVFGNPTADDTRVARKGFEKAEEVIKSGEYDLVILDEAVTAVKSKLIKKRELIKLIEEKPEGVELVLTGRGATKELMKYADLVTEMKEIKHYYKDGVKARKGIER